MGMARMGGGTYSASNSSAELVNQIKAFFAQIQAVNSVAASVALPVSVNVRGTYLNQIYMGMTYITNIGSDYAGQKAPIKFTMSNLPATVTFTSAAPAITM